VPNRVVALVAQLTLDLLRRETLLGRGQKVHRDEPVSVRQLRLVHHRAAFEGDARAARLALPLLLVALPIVIGAAATVAHDSGLLAELLEFQLATQLVRKLLHKIYQCHAQYFSAKVIFLGIYAGGHILLFIPSR